MKDAAACDKPREGGKQPLIRGFPNGETLRWKNVVNAAKRRGVPREVKHLSTRRKRKKSCAPHKNIPLVVASEKGMV